MRIPGKSVCDLCRADLTAPHVRMAYPLDAAVVKLLEAHVQFPSLPNLFGALAKITPDAWSFEFCTGCAEGFMPMLAELKTQAIKTWLAERARRAELPIGEHDR
jgi:hypothetical protein